MRSARWSGPPRASATWAGSASRSRRPEGTQGEVVLIGHVARPHGVRGALRVRATGATLASLRAGERIEVGGRTMEVTEVGGSAQRPILSLHGVETREAAQALAGARIEVQEARLPEAGEAEWYVRDLIGCAVYEGDRHVGDVVDVENSPANDVLVIDAAGRALRIALVAESVPRVDPGRRRIDIVPGRAIAHGGP